MTDNSTTLTEGDTYLVIYTGGPFDGQTETRTATSDGYDSRIAAYAAVDGQETEIAYTAVSSKDFDGTLHVSYAVDVADSDPIDDPEDRGGRQ